MSTSNSGGLYPPQTGSYNTLGGFPAPRSEIAPLDKPLTLLDQVLYTNKEAPSLSSLYAQAYRAALGNFWVTDRLLFYSGRLVLPIEDLVITRVIAEAYTQVSTAYPGRDKTYYLLAPRYYWPRIRANID